MSQPTFYADIHCHPTMRAINTQHTQPNACMWEKITNQRSETAIGRWASIQTKGIAKYSQTNLYAAQKGNVRILFDSLYPIEKGFGLFRQVPTFVIGKKNASEILQSVTGIHPNRADVLTTQFQYFEELQEQYAFVKNNQGYSPCQQYSYEIAQNYSHLSQLIQEKTNTIALILTIEGAHAFGVGYPNHPKLSLAQLKNTLTKNIATVKQQWQHPVFFVTFAHHFWNQLCGHARSLKGVMNAAYNQRRGMNLGFTPLGWHAINELLTTRNGKRILIDVKHMSAHARLQYYRFVERHNYISPNDKIPIICSHAAINGVQKLTDLLIKRDQMPILNNGYFHNWKINLTVQDIQVIHRSEGLIGIMIDKSLLGSQQVLQYIQKLESPQQQKHEYLQLIWSNIFGIVSAVNHPSAWNIIAFGSDYDGIITHIDPYNQYETMPQLNADLIQFLYKTNFCKELWFNYTPEALVQKIMQTNVLNFLQKNFL